ncbi:MAG: AzlD domain-containing protein [Thermoleophilaceae bacterium]|nr:AzlD domain-containing protein [Thermoleophilaceae bacterium]
MTEAWITIAGLAVGTVVIKAFGPITAGGRELPPRATAVIALVAPALLAALVVTLTMGADRSGITLDARAVGLLAAGAGLAARLPLLAVMGLATIAAATARALT